MSVNLVFLFQILHHNI